VKLVLAVPSGGAGVGVPLLGVNRGAGKQSVLVAAANERVLGCPAVIPAVCTAKV